MRFARSLLFSIGMIASTLALALLIPLALPFAHPTRYRILNQWSHFNIWWLRVSVGIRYRVIGRENIPSTTSIVLSKHQSTWETLALQQIFPIQTWVLKRSLLPIPLFGWGLALLKPVAIDRKAGKKALKQVLEQGGARLNEGIWVVVFPEGTRTAPGEHRPYHIGGAMLASKSGYPVVPVAHNAGQFWPRGGFLKTPGEITVVVGEPIATQGRKPAEINAEVEAWIESRMAEISPEHYPKSP